MTLAQNMMTKDIKWIEDDLKKSGLDLESFQIEPLKGESQLKERLGFTQIGGTQLKDIACCWYSYPNVPGHYRLKLKEKIGDIKYLSPKDSVNHAYIPQATKEVLSNNSPDKPIFIPEGEKKAQKATLEGFPSIGLSGVWNFQDGEDGLLPELEEVVWMDRKVYIAFDSDISDKHNVRHAELRLAVFLFNRGAQVYSLRLPNESDGKKNGLDDYLVRYGTEAFRQVIKDASPTIELQVEEGTNTRLILKELPRLNNEIQRVKVLKSIAKREGVTLAAVEAEYKKHIPKKQKAELQEEETFTPEEMEKALNLLQSGNILTKMLAHTNKLGLVGEEINKTILYLCFTSRLQNDSMSPLIKGPSSSGKSWLANTIKSLFPASDVLSFSFLTSKALVHREGNLSHKILFIQEHSGSQSADYSIRTLLSEGEISIMLPIKNETTGDFTTIEKRIPAVGLVYVETTTRERIHAENQTRVFDLYTDESPEQTVKILESQAKQTVEIDHEVNIETKVWRAAQTLLKSYEVYVPYARALVEGFPKDKSRVRRDFKRLLSLIKTHTLLYQYQRDINERGCLVSTWEDFKSILPLAEAVLAQSIKERSPKQDRVLEIIEQHFLIVEFSLKELNEKTQKIIGYRSLQRYVDGFVKDGLLEWNGQKAKDSRYTCSDSLSSCRKGGLFTSNFLKSLEKTHVNESLTSYDVIDVKEDIDDIHVNSRQNGMSSKEPNDDRRLTNDKGINDNYDKDNQWDQEANDFLRQVINGGNI